MYETGGGADAGGIEKNVGLLGRWGSAEVGNRLDAGNGERRDGLPGTVESRWRRVLEGGFGRRVQGGNARLDWVVTVHGAVALGLGSSVDRTCREQHWLPRPIQPRQLHRSPPRLYATTPLQNPQLNKRHHGLANDHVIDDIHSDQVQGCL